MSHTKRDVSGFEAPEEATGSSGKSSEEAAAAAAALACSKRFRQAESCSIATG